jgi:hypothetical protein
MRHRLASLAPVLFVPLASLACAPAKLPQAAIKAPQQAAAGQLGPRERLARALRSIPRPPPVWAALPEGAQQRLQARLSGLDAEHEQSIRAEDSPLVETLPLLHLASGGGSPRALYALSTTPVASQELAALLGPEGPAQASSPYAARVAIVREIARRAAFDFLRDRAADVLQTGKGMELACRLVARVALTVDRRDLTLLAREVLASSAPNSDNRLEFAAELARAGRVDQAARVVADKKHPLREGAAAAIDPLLTVARLATTAPLPGALDERLKVARAWLRLGRADRAAALLEPYSGLAKTRLDLASALAEAEIENPSCPQLPPDVGSAQLCAAAFRTSEQVKTARASLDAAWQSGAGRDDEAIEVYAALAHVIPWVHETASELSRGALSAEQGQARMAALSQKIAEIAAVAPKLSGLVLFLETVPRAEPHTSGRRSDADAKALTARALSLASSDTTGFAQAGVLAVAAALSHQQDIGQLLDAVPAQGMSASLGVARTALEVWAAASTGSAERMAAARAQLAAVMAQGLGTSLERSRLVLSVTEADALLDSTDRSYQLLSRVSGQLLNDNIPPELAFRAVLDASGALAHGERFEQADRLLKGAVNAEIPPDLERARDLLQLIRGYHLLLAAHGAPLAGFSELRAGLARLGADSYSETSAVWFELWKRELDAAQRDAECSKRKLTTCREAEALRRQVYRGFEEQLGAPGNAVLLRGALPSGSFEAGFRFTIESGLEALIAFDPNFLAVGLPKNLSR